MATIDYARVSTREGQQVFDRQRGALRAAEPLPVERARAHALG